MFDFIRWGRHGYDRRVALEQIGWQPRAPLKAPGSLLVEVKAVFIVHVGGNRCVTSSTDHSMKIHVRITLTVAFIRTCIFLFLFYV